MWALHFPESCWLEKDRKDSDENLHQILNTRSKNKSKLTILKLQTIKGKEKMLKATRMKRQTIVKRKSIKRTVTDDRRQRHLPIAKEKPLSNYVFNCSRNTI